MGEWDVINEKPIGEWDIKTETPYSPEAFPQLQPKPNVEVAKTLLPIALDIAGGFAASKIPVPLSLMTKAPTLAKATQTGLRIAGAGMGGAAGSAAGQMLDSGKIDWGQVGLQGGIGAASEVVFPLMKFGAKGIKLLENITVAGKTIKSFLRDRIEKKAIQRGSEFIVNAAPDIVKNLDETGDVGKAINMAFDENKLVYQQFREGIERAQDANGEIYLADTVNYLNEKMSKYIAKGKSVSQAETAILKEYGYPVSGNIRRVLSQIMKGDPVDPKDFEWMFYNWNPKTQKAYETGLLESVKSKRIELKNVLLDDIDRLSGGTGEAKRAADKVHGALKEYEALKSIFDKNIIDAENGIRFYPQRLGETLLKQKNRIASKNPELWLTVQQEANHYLDVAKKLKETRVENIKGGGVTGGALGYFLLGPKGSVAVETLGALSALGTMSDTMAAILTGGGRAATKSLMHIGGQTIEFK